jgi:peptide maturation system protein (TIGR04066 family)
MRKLAALYPYAPEYLPFVKYFNCLQSDYSFINLISPVGLGLTGKDAGYARNHNKIGIQVTDALGLDNALWKTLILAKATDTKITDEEIKILQIADEVLHSKRNILFFDTSQESIPLGIKTLMQKYPKQFRLVSSDMHKFKDKNHNRQLNPIDIPIIFVGGLLAEADVFEVVITLTKYMKNNGKYPLVLTRHPVGEIFGFVSYLHILNNQFLSESDKIMHLNAFVKDMTFLKVPDVIIVEAPGGVMRFNEIAPNGFGIHSFMMCQALPPDYFICSLPFNYGVGEFIESINEHFLHTLGVPITAVHLSNIVLDSAEMLQSKRISYTHENPERVKKHLAKERENSTVPMFDIVGEDIHSVYKGILNG